MKRSAIKKRPMQDSTLKGLEPEDNEYRASDGNGLYFRVKPNGNKSWQLHYKKPDGTWSWLGLGSFEHVGGELARQHAEEARKLIKQGIDPAEHKQQQKQAALETSQFTFKHLAMQFCNSKTWTPATRTRNEGALNNHVYPAMGNRDFRKIRKAEWLELFQAIQQKPHPLTGKPIVEMGNRVRGLCKDIYDLAELKQWVEYNPIVGLEKGMQIHKKQNMPHIKEEELPDLLRAIRAYPNRVTSIGLQLSLMLGTRPSEMRTAKWEEFSIDKALWTIPAERMKTRIEHTIPLPKQAIELLKELKYYSGESPYLFKGRGKSNQPISNNTFNKALKVMGYQGKQTPHGFRHILSTTLREKGVVKEFVESALAHKVGGVEGTYNKAVYLKQRTIMMQKWADHLDALANGEHSVLDDQTNNLTVNNLFNGLQLSAEQLAVVIAFVSKLTESDADLNAA